MKTYRWIWSVLCMGLFLFASTCRENVYSPLYPYDEKPAYEVELVSIVITGRDQVRLRGSVSPLVADGFDDGYVGFYWSENPSPSLNDQQFVARVQDDGSFVGEEIELTPGRQYHLSAFAADKERFYKSEVVEFFMP